MKIKQKESHLSIAQTALIVQKLEENNWAKIAVKERANNRKVAERYLNCITIISRYEDNLTAMNARIHSRIMKLNLDDVNELEFLYSLMDDIAKMEIKSFETIEP